MKNIRYFFLGACVIGALARACMRICVCVRVPVCVENRIHEYSFCYSFYLDTCKQGIVTV